MAYVYGHYRNDTNQLFYIGKGTGDRAWHTRRRNKYWNNIVKKHGFTVKILEDGLTEEQAFETEKKLIAQVGLENLANLTEGGDGFTSKFLKERFKDPEHRKKISEIKKKQIAENPEYRAQLFDRLKSVHDQEWKQKWKQKISEGQLRRYSTKTQNGKSTIGEDTRKLHKNLAKERWKDPEYRKNQLEARKNSPKFQEKLRLMREKAVEKRKKNK
jgi:hypothetical protein